MAVIFGGKSGMTTTYSAYLAEVGYETILLIGGNLEKLEL